MANFYVSSVAYAAVAVWTAATTLAVGAIRKPTAPASGREYCYRVSAITTGVTAGTQPSWPLTANGTVVDGGVTWTECTGQEAYQAAGNWTAPAGTLDAIVNDTNGRGSAVGADVVFVDSAHSESWSSSIFWGHGGAVVCVTVAGSALPPTAASLTTGARVTTTGSTTLQITLLIYFQGIAFSIGSGAASANINVGSSTSDSDVTFQGCTIAIAGTSGGTIQLVGTTRASLTLVDTPITFASTSQNIGLNLPGQSLYLKGGSFAGTVPTNLFGIASFTGIVEGVDLSNVSTNLLAMNTVGNRSNNFFSMRYCKVNASATLATPQSWGGFPMSYTALEGLNSAPLVNQRLMAPGGANVTATNIVRANGATINGTAVSFALVNAASNSGPGWGGPDCAPGNQDLSPWVWTNLAASGSPVTLTVYLVANKATLPTANQIWAEVAYLADATSPLMTIYQPNNPEVGVNLNSPAASVADSSDWGSLSAAARSNSTAYALMDVIRVSTNTTRLFFCATAGTTAGSLPAGYATAVDGGSVTDGTAVFRAGWRMSYALTVTPQQAGLAGIRLHYAMTENPQLNVYLDPTVAVS